MNTMKAFVYFAESEIIEEMLPDWPSEMRLALCLHESGACEIIVFHRNETDRIITRMSGILNLRGGSFSIAPKIPGYPTKVIKFSEQQQFLKLIAAENELCETASDYAINYRFAKEEGLDPSHFMHRSPIAKSRVKKARSKGNVSTKPFESRRAKSKEESSPVLSLKKESVRSAKPKPDTDLTGSFIEVACIELRDQNIRLTLNPNVASNVLPILQATQVGYRDEFGQFTLPRGLLREWKAGKSAIIEIPIEKLFHTLSGDNLKQPHVGVVLIVPNGIFVTCGSEISPDDPKLDYIPLQNSPFYKNVNQEVKLENNQVRCA